MGATLIDWGTQEERDPDPDVSYLEPGMWPDDDDAEAMGAARLAAYRAGEFGLIGVYAWAEIDVRGTVQTVRTPGLWGIESDSDPAYIRQVQADELAELAALLDEMGAFAPQLAPLLAGI